MYRNPIVCIDGMNFIIPHITEWHMSQVAAMMSINIYVAGSDDPFIIKGSEKMITETDVRLANAVSAYYNNGEEVGQSNETGEA